jgi:hypothetical protein
MRRPSWQVLSAAVLAFVSVVATRAAPAHGVDPVDPVVSIGGGVTAMCGGTERAFVAVGSTVYSVDAGADAQALDIGVTAPVPQGIRALACDDGVLLVSTSLGRVCVYDLVAAATLEQTDCQDTDLEVIAAAMDEGRVVVGSTDGTLELLVRTRDGLLERRARLHVDGTITSVAIKGLAGMVGVKRDREVVYRGATTRFLVHAADTGLIATGSIPKASPVVAVALTDERAYVAEVSGQVSAHGQESGYADLSRLDLLTELVALQVTGDGLTAVSRRGEVMVLSRASADLTLAGSTVLPSELTAVAAVGDRALVGDVGGNWWVVDVAAQQPALVVARGTVGLTNALAARGHTVVGSAADGSLDLLRTGSSAVPLYVGQVALGAMGQALYASSKQVYVAAGRDGVFSLVWSDVGLLELAGHVETGGVAVDVVAASGSVYVACSDAGVDVLTEGGVPALVPAGHVDVPGMAQSVAARDTTLYVGTRFGGIQVLDVADPSRPVVVDEIAVGSPVLSLSSLGDLLYAGTAAGEVRVWDISRRHAPVLVVNSRAGASILDVAVDEAVGSVYAALGKFGLVRLVRDQSGTWSVQQAVPPSLPAFGVSVHHGGVAVASGVEGVSWIRRRPAAIYLPTAADSHVQLTVLPPQPSSGR